MSGLAVIADDLTGACDVGAAFADAGMRVHVVCDGADAMVATDDTAVRVVNTQSRSLTPEAAGRRVREAVVATKARLLVKKIDTALRGHLGAELDAALDASGAAAAFVVPAIPAAGRVTRDGRQWFSGRLLEETEFARDPEGAGPESSVAAVIARESARPAAIVPLETVRGGDLHAIIRRHLERGTVYVVLDAETDEDVAAGVAAVLGLPRPTCLVGSIALAAAVAGVVDADGAPVASSSAMRRPAPLARSGGWSPATPALVVCGSLHSNARAQVGALASAGLATALDTERLADDPEPIGLRAATLLASGRSVTIVARPVSGTPERAALRATEDWLAEVTSATVAAYMPRTIVLIGGETSFGILRRLGATTIEVRGNFMPLVTVSEIRTGTATGATLVTKGGSGGDPEALVRMFDAARGAGTMTHTRGVGSCG